MLANSCCRWRSGVSPVGSVVGWGRMVGMLSLQSNSSARWLNQVDRHLEEILIDHAHCEHKAAATAMSLLGPTSNTRRYAKK